MDQKTTHEVGRHEENLSHTAWGDPVRPHSLPNTVRKEDCDQDPTSETAVETQCNQFSSSQQ